MNKRQIVLSVNGTDHEVWVCPSDTLLDVLHDELQQVRGFHPALVTVWASTTDLLAGVAPTAYGQALGELLAGLRAKGRTVLVGNAPPLQLVPSYAHCLGDPSSCGLSGSSSRSMAHSAMRNAASVGTPR